MNLLFEQLWNGNVAPYKTCGSDDPEMAAPYELVENNKATLEDSFSGQQRELFQRYASSSGEYTYLNTVHAFRSGLSLAVRLLAEAFLEEKPQPQ